MESGKFALKLPHSCRAEHSCVSYSQLCYYSANSALRRGCRTNSGSTSATIYISASQIRPWNMFTTMDYFCSIKYCWILVTASKASLTCRFPMKTGWQFQATHSSLISCLTMLMRNVNYSSDSLMMFSAFLSNSKRSIKSHTPLTCVGALFSFSMDQGVLERHIYIILFVTSYARRGKLCCVLLQVALQLCFFLEAALLTQHFTSQSTPSMQNHFVISQNRINVLNCYVPSI